MDRPKVSVIMSVYNTEKTLERCMNSVLNQTCNNFEFIIINDNSIDNTAKILNTYAAKDKRIKLIENEKNIGLS